MTDHLIILTHHTVYWIQKMEFSIENDLIFACKDGEVSKVSSLLKQGALIDSQNEYKHSALMIACVFQHEEIVQLLLSNGSNPDLLDGDNESSLMAAAINGNRRIVQLLLDYNADVDIRGRNEYSALMWAVRFHRVEIVQLLIYHGANIHLVDELGRTAAEMTTDQDIKKIIEESQGRFTKRAD